MVGKRTITLLDETLGRLDRTNVSVSVECPVVTDHVPPTVLQGLSCHVPPPESSRSKVRTVTTSSDRYTEFVEEDGETWSHRGGEILPLPVLTDG